jgi:hypothetical protein
MDFAESFRRTLGAAFNVCMYNLPTSLTSAVPSHLVWRGCTVDEHQAQLLRLRGSPHFVQEEKTEKDGRPIHWFKLHTPLSMEGREYPPMLSWLECPPADPIDGGGLRGLVLHTPGQPRQVLVKNIRCTRFTPGGMNVWGQPWSADMIIAEHKVPKLSSLPV